MKNKIKLGKDRVIEIITENRVKEIAREEDRKIFDEMYKMFERLNKRLMRLEKIKCQD